MAHCHCSQGVLKEEASPWWKFSAGCTFLSTLAWSGFRGCALQAAGCCSLRLTGWTLSDGRVRCTFSSPWRCPPGRPTPSLWKQVRGTNGCERSRNKPTECQDLNISSAVVDSVVTSLVSNIQEFLRRSSDTKWLHFRLQPLRLILKLWILPVNHTLQPPSAVLETHYQAAGSTATSNKNMVPLEINKLGATCLIYCFFPHYKESWITRITVIECSIFFLST